MTSSCTPVIASALDAPPTEDDVRACYRLLLGREPESEQAVRLQQGQHRTVGALRAAFMASTEFRAASGPATLPRMPIAVERPSIDIVAPPGTLNTMLARVGAYWARAGDEAPHWSVLTDERFRPGSIEANLDVFFSTGQAEARMVHGILARHGIPPSEMRRVVEFGCGVGRVTVALAPLFAEVTGCDISPGHLALAARAAESRGLSNLSWHRATVEAPMPPGPCDLWFSRIVLQHNPPPVMAWLLRQAFDRLAPGGVAIFQLPTHAVGYGFDAAGYLAREERPDMEMHVLPQEAVFALAAEAGLEVLQVREDSYIFSNPARWLSNLFTLRRPRS